MIQDNYNDNIKFYLWDITRAYIEIASYLNPDFYIRIFSKLISQLSALFDSIVKVIRPLYSELEADNYRFTVYHLYYKKKTQDDRVRTKLLPGASFDCCGWKDLLIAIFFAHDRGAYITTPGIINEFNLRFVIKQILIIILLYLVRNN